MDAIDKVPPERIAHPLKSFYSRFAKNSILYFASQIIGKGLFFLITVYLARILGAQNYGKFAFAFGLVTLLSVISKFGLDLLTSRDVGENPAIAPRYFQASFTLRVILSTLFCLIILLIIAFINKPYEVDRLIIFLAIAASLQSIAASGTSLFEGLQLFGYRSFLNICMYGFILVAVVAATLHQPSVDRIGPAFLTGAVMYFLITVLLAHLKVAKIRLSFDFPFVWELFRMAIPLGLTELFIGIYYRVDTVLLSLLDTDTVVGWYDAAYTFVYVLRLLPVTVAMVLLPSLSNVFSRSEEEGTQIYRSTLQISITAGFLIVFLIALNSKYLVSFVYGKEYGPSSEVLKILIWTCVIMFANAFQGIFLVITQQRNAFFQATAIGAVSNLILNLYLIPRWGMYGAAVATVLSEFFVFLASAAFLKRFVGGLRYFKMLFAPVIGVSLITLLWIWIGARHFILLNFLSVLIYATVVKVVNARLR